ncbi:amino acid/amide ABC transporter substrate-binding protein (HAAT family) [Paucimonas lemoignei]|uniref:Amino acid/amide ABC transporter substrate-binding protein (HAAT family) n=1 Tax=Paucimonas lemoignei TaxID=29443 RepID=A0A4R3HYI6_PAULE|nr:ABC transporter substrate-binding protein [Paucimonas lemoignei]TCS37371.1 amino acid/amide ABC transporter substrate-binding protein (HAAT family) [Paucimonas lemoignei]
MGIKLTFKKMALASSLGLAFAAPHASAQISDGVVKIGLLMDMSGTYSDVAGMGSVTAAKMAVEDFGGKVLGKPIEVVYADMQNKVDIASTKAREWFDEKGVDAIMDVNMSSAGFAVSDLAKEKNKLVVINISGSPRFTNENCNANTIHYVYDTYALARSTGKAVLKSGGDSWYFITVDYTFGHDFERDTMAVVKAGGGKVLGSVRVPLNAPDYSSPVTQALASKAKVVAFSTAGADTANSIKTASEFGIAKNGQRVAGMLVYINEVHALGLEKAQGMLLTTGFYWDMNDETRAFSKRYFERMKKMPNMSQAGVYSSTMHYLKALQAAGTDDTAAVMKKMKETPINDFFAKNGKIREDGRMVHDLYLMQVKTPKESKYPWDYYKLVQTVPGNEAFTPVSESRCPLLKK